MSKLVFLNGLVWFFLGLLAGPIQADQGLSPAKQALVQQLKPFWGSLSADSPRPLIVLHAACSGDLRRSQGMGEDFGRALETALEAWQGFLPSCGLFAEVHTKNRGVLTVAGLRQVLQAQPFRPYVYAMHFVAHERTVTPIDFVRHPVPAHLLGDPGGELAWRFSLQDASAKVPADETQVAIVEVASFLLRGGEVKPARYHRTRTKVLDEIDIQRAIESAGDWLVQEPWGPIGCFPYSYKPAQDRFDDEGYNLLRHLGVVWSLLQAHEATGRMDFLRRAEDGLRWIEQFGRIESTSVGPARFLVEPLSGKAKLGGTALWLLALVEHAELTASDEHAGTIRELVLHLLRSQDPSNGHFASFAMGPGLAPLSGPSEYYPPQALFALMRAKAWVDDLPICRRAVLGLHHLLGKQPRTLSVDEVHFVNQWTVYAVGQVQQHCGVHEFDWFWAREMDHLEATEVKKAKDPILAGAQQVGPVTFDPNPTRLEALSTMCASYRATGQREMVARCAPLVERALALQLSVQNGPENDWVWPHPQRAAGGFARTMKDETLRMDIVQHNLSALVLAMDFLSWKALAVEPQTFKAKAPDRALDDWLTRWSADQTWGVAKVSERATRPQIVRSAELTARYLKKHQRPSGDFEYLYNMFLHQPGIQEHAVRQAGALWALARLTAWRPNAADKEALARGLDFYLTHLRTGPVPGTLLLNKPGEPVLKIGTQALLVLALADTLDSKIPLDKSRRERLEHALAGLMNGLWWAQRRDGHFADQVHLLSVVPADVTSPYADGEALLALSRGAVVLKRKAWAKRLRSTALVMMDVYSRRAWAKDPDSEDTKGFYQWGSMAFDVLGQAGWMKRDEADRFILALAWWQLHIHRLLERKGNIAYAIEGLVLALPAARRKKLEPAVKSLEAALEIGVLRLLRLQVSGPRYKDNPFLANLGRVDLRAVGGVLKQQKGGLIRVDMVQHHALALLGYLRLAFLEEQ